MFIKKEKGGVEDQTSVTKEGEQRDDADGLQKQPTTNHWIPSLREDEVLI